MTIKDHSLLKEYIGKWICNYTNHNNIECLIVNFIGTCNDAMLLSVCTEALKYCNKLTMEIVSSSFPGEGQPKDILSKIYSKKNNIKYIEVPTNFSSLPFLYLMSHSTSQKHCIVLGPIDKTYGQLYRGYDKLAEYTSDIFPLYDIKYSDIFEFVMKEYPEIDWKEQINKKECRYLEWGLSVNEKYGIIESEDSPTKHYKWPYFTTEQKQYVALLHQREKNTRHKKLNKPYLSFKGKQFVYE